MAQIFTLKEFNKILHENGYNNTKQDDQLLMDIANNTHSRLQNISKESYDNYTKLVIHAYPTLSQMNKSEQVRLVSDFKYFQNLSDSRKDIVLQHVLQRINDKFTDNSTNNIDSEYVNQTLIEVHELIEYDKTHPEDTYDIIPQEWITHHSNSTINETIGKFDDDILKYINNDNMTSVDVNKWNTTLTQEQRTQLQKYYDEYIQQVNTTISEQQNNSTNITDISKNSTDTPTSEVAPNIITTKQSDKSGMVVIFVLLFSTLALFGALLFRRYMNRRNLMPFRMNEELSVQGIQSF